MSLLNELRQQLCRKPNTIGGGRALLAVYSSEGTLLLDVIEGFAKVEPLWRDDELDFGGCLYCDGAQWNASGFPGAGPECAEEDRPPHDRTCPYRLALVACGYEDDDPHGRREVSHVQRG